MAESPLRYKRLIREIPKHKTARDAVLAAGFSESVANTQAKRVINAAIKHQAREILARDDKSVKSRELMREIVGLSREELFETLKKIALQDKDYSSALKVLGPLAREEGVALQEESGDKVTVPVLNVIVERNEEEEPLELENMAKNIEGEPSDEKQESQE